MSGNVVHIIFGAAEGAVALPILVSLGVLLVCYTIDKKKYRTKGSNVDTRFWRNARIGVSLWISMCTGWWFFFAVAFGALPWVAGAFLVTIVWTVLYANIVRYEHLRLLAQDSNKVLLEHVKLIAQQTHEVFVADGAETQKDEEGQKGHKKTKLTFSEYKFTMKDALLSRKYIFLAGVAVIIVIAFIVAPALDCLCLAVNPVEGSTRWSRSISPSKCYNAGICHVYVTMADSGSDFIVNLHSGVSPSSVYVQYDTISGAGYRYSANVTTVKMFNILEEDRFIHWSELSNLIPGTTYYFAAVFTDQNGVTTTTKEYKIRTLPDDDNYNFISGGDTSADRHVVTFMNLAGEREPYFAMVGGDIAYDNGMKYCYRRWDTWIGHWHDYMVTTSGYTIPIIMAIGNHETGAFKMYGERAPFYTAYFPFQNGLQNVDPHGRPVFHSHRISRQGFILVLDSDVVTTMEGQTAFIDSELTAAHAENRTTIFVLYHGSIYNSIPAFLGRTIDIEGKKHWTPLFDKHRVTAVFENHVHAYKRTKPLRGDQVVAAGEGTVYLGDGAWGVELNPLSAEMSWYTDVSKKIRHVYHVDVTPTHIHADAIDIDGNVFDTWDRAL